MPWPTIVHKKHSWHVAVPLFTLKFLLEFQNLFRKPLLRYKGCSCLEISRRYTVVASFLVHWLFWPSSLPFFVCPEYCVQEFCCHSIHWDWATHSQLFLEFRPVVVLRYDLCLLQREASFLRRKNYTYIWRHKLF